jgi:hypothetical protein
VHQHQVEGQDDLEVEGHRGAVVGVLQDVVVEHREWKEEGLLHSLEEDLPAVLGGLLVGVDLLDLREWVQVRLLV